MLPPLLLPLADGGDQCGRWPTLWILGVQKAATTSLAEAFDAAGVGRANGCCWRSAAKARGQVQCGKETEYFMLNTCEDERIA